MPAEPKTRPTDASVDDFIASAEPPRRREEGRALKALLEEVTGERPVMWGPSIVGYGSYRGPTGDWPVIGFSPRKAASVLYILPELMETETALMERLDPSAHGKSCLYIKRLDQVDMGALRELCELSVKAVRAGAPGC